MNQESKTSTSECPKCHGDGWILMDFNGTLTSKRCDCYKKIKIQRANEKSGFPKEEYENMTLDKFKVDTKERKEMKDLAEKFIKEPSHGIGYFGRSGTGKTHICIAICQALLEEKNLEHRYFSYRREMHNILANYYNEDYFDQKFKDITSCDVLYIDDLLKFSVDKDGQQNKRELQILYEIINERVLGKKITIFSSEYSLNDIAKIDEAIGSRIYEMIYPYAMKCEGDNYRIKGVKK